MSLASSYRLVFILRGLLVFFRPLRLMEDCVKRAGLGKKSSATGAVPSFIITPFRLLNMIYS